MARNEIKVADISIWKTFLQGKTGYAVVLDFCGGGCAINLYEAKYKKDLIPKIKQARKMLKSISTDDQIKILHFLWDYAKERAAAAPERSTE